MRRYPISAYHQISLDGERERLESLDPVEDGDHYQPVPNFIEWWYFDAAFEDGSHLVVILHSNLFTIHADLPTVDLRYYPPAGFPVVAVGHFDRTVYSAASDCCRVKIGDCLAVDEGDNYRLDLHQGALAAELVFWPCLPGWKPGTTHLFADPASGHYFDWIVPLPRARVEGTLTVAGQRRHVVGVGYHDHNWSNVYMGYVFDQWTWGRVMTDDWTLVFFDLVGRRSIEQRTPLPRITPMMLAYGDQMLLSTDAVNIRGDELMRDPSTGTNYFRHLHLATEKTPVVKMDLEIGRTMDSVVFASLRWPLASRCLLRKVGDTAFYVAQGKPIVGHVAGWLLGKGTYLRCEADCRLYLSGEDIVTPGKALYETMRF